MSRRRAMVLLGFWVFLLVWCGTPTAAAAWSCDTDYGFVATGALVPANSPGLLWLGEYGARTDKPGPVALRSSDGHPLPVAAERFGRRGTRQNWLFRPREGFEPGASYVFSTSTDGERQEVRVTVSDRVARSPDALVTLRIGPMTLSEASFLPIWSRERVRRVQRAELPLSMVLPPGLEPFRSQFLYETIVDGNFRWEGGGLCPRVRTGKSEHGDGKDLLYSACGVVWGLPAGRHTVEMRAWLPGTDVRVASRAETVELHCPEGTPPWPTPEERAAEERRAREAADREVVSRSLSEWCAKNRGREFGPANAVQRQMLESCPEPEATP